MKKDRWIKIESILNEAADLEPGKRDTFLKNACGGDNKLIEEIKELLSNADSELDLLKKPLVNISKNKVFGDAAGDEKTTIGPYRIIRLLAHGGMGKVFLARRIDEAFDRFVALKVIRKELDSDELTGRFYHERQILASLNHPNIARIYGGGLTDDGLPWFAMEFVEGKPLHHYTRQNSLDIDERLNLFLKICSTVQYAHRNLVVHRDLKPENILVTENGTVKLLDFGIAKLLESEEDENQTVFRQLLTPEYASPEQVKQDPVTTASDIYSLGVLLYELLTGQLPYRLEARNPAEIEKVICETDPPKPSTVDLSDPASDSTPKAERMRLKKRLAGDLDNIILKALQKNPDNRYSTVEQFAEDIRRHQRGLPVIARPDQFHYRAGKFIGRHRFGVAAMAAFILLVSGFGLVAMHQSAAIKAGALETEQERDRAELVSRFLVDLFGSADPSEAGDASITAYELLQRGVERAQNDLDNRPGLASELFLVISEVYEKLGLFEEAEPLNLQALELQRQIYGEESPEAAYALNALGWLYYQKGDFQQADSLLTAALHLRQSLLGEDHLDLSRTMNDLAVVKQAAGDYAATDSLLKKALDIRREQLGDTHEGLGITLNNYAALKWRLGQVEEATEYMGDALRVLQANLGNDDLRVANAMTNLAVFHLVGGNTDEAESLYREALSIRYKLVGEEHPDVAGNLAHLGNLLRHKGEFDEAEQMLLKALELRRNLLGESHVLIGDSKRVLGILYAEAGNYEAALEQYKLAENLFREVLPGGHTRLGTLLDLKGGLYLTRNQPHNAEPLLREALEIKINHYGTEGIRTAEAMVKLGINLFELEQHNEAKNMLLNGLKILKENDLADELIVTAEDILAKLD